MSEGTMCYVIDIGDFRIVVRDSAGPIGDEEHEWFGAHPGCDMALVAYTGRAAPARQVGDQVPSLL